METPLRSPPWPETDLHHQADNQEKAHGGDLQCRWWYQNDGCQCQEKVADQNKEAETITSARSHWRSANPHQTQKETHEWNQNSCNAIRFFSQSTIKNYTSIMMWLINRACNMTPHNFFRWQSPSPCTVSTKSKPCPRSNSAWSVGRRSDSGRAASNRSQLQPWLGIDTWSKQPKRQCSLGTAQLPQPQLQSEPNDLPTGNKSPPDCWPSNLCHLDWANTGKASRQSTTNSMRRQTWGKAFA